MLLGLSGLLVVVHTAVASIREMNDVITADTAPGVVALNAMSVNTARLRGLLAEALKAPADIPALGAQVAEERSALAESVWRWFALPIDPGEGELMSATRVGMDRLDDLTRRILATSPATPPATRDALKAELDAVTSDLDGVVLRASELNADLARHAGASVDRVGRRLLNAAIGIEAASLILGAFALGAAYRVSRAQAAVAERWVLRQKNAELEAFAGRVAHDVLSPLMTVSLALGLAEQRLEAPGDARVHGMVARAATSVQRVRQVVSDLLEFARAAASPPPGAETEVAPLLQSLVYDLEPLASEAGVDLHITTAAPVRVRCASGILSSILTNLVQNAIRHAGEEGHRVDVRAIDAGREVRFEVEDTGPGVPPEDRQRIFEPYVRATEKGTGLGLGLATVKRLAESHGGHVGVGSPAGGAHGALFWVTLPALSRSA
jgi:signal transduction histidine kinase